MERSALHFEFLRKLILLVYTQSLELQSGIFAEYSDTPVLSFPINYYPRVYDKFRTPNWGFRKNLK